MAVAIRKKRMTNDTASARRDSSRALRRTRDVRRNRKVNPRQGPSLERFLREVGIFEEAAACAIKEVLIFQIEAAMKRRAITKAEMARRMATSRAALDRLLDPDNPSVTLATLFRAASALGSELRIALVDRPRARRRARAGKRRRR